MTIDDILAKFSDVKPAGKGFMAKCPSHDDGNASLSIGVGDDGRTLLHCHTGCKLGDILSAAGLKVGDLFPRPERPSVKIKTGGIGKSKIITEYDYRDESGNLLFQAVRLEPKSFRQRTPKPDGGWEWKLNGVRRVPYRLPELLKADPADEVFVVEGEKDVDNLRAVGLVATCNVGGAGKWLPDYSQFITGRAVVILADNDEPGRKHAHQVAKLSHGVAKSIRVVELPDLPEKGDVSDWLAAGGTVEKLRELVEAAPEWDAASAPAGEDEIDSRPAILITTDEIEVADAAVKALSRDKGIFQRAGSLVKIVSDNGKLQGIVRPAGSARPVPIPAPTLRERLTSVARFIKLVKVDDGIQEKAVHPPQWLVNAIHTRNEWEGVPYLEQVVSGPILRPDGSICSTPGYDESTGIYLESTCELVDIPEHPTLEQAQEAAGLLLDVVGDFPLKEPMHRSAWLAFAITPAGRFAYSGPTPLVYFDANIPGAGKTMLGDVVSIINTGREAARMAYVHNDDEMRKRILSIALAADPIVLIDNVAGVFGCASLDAALTSTVIKDRILGKSETVEAPLLSIFCGTGNNTIFAADTSRRIAHVRLESPEEHPEERTGFKYPDLLGYVRQNRGRLLAAALTILRAYHVAGRPKQPIPPWGSFEGWSDFIRSAVVWLGMVDPGESRQQIREQADSEAVALRGIVAALSELDPNGYGLSVAQMVELMEDKDATDAAKTLRESIVNICSSRSGFPSNKSIGRKLMHFRGRVVDGKSLQSKPSKYSLLWTVRG